VGLQIARTIYRWHAQRLEQTREGTYDAFFVEFESGNIIHLRFGQVAVQREGRAYIQCCSLLREGGLRSWFGGNRFFLTSLDASSFSLTEITSVKFLPQYNLHKQLSGTLHMTVSKGCCALRVEPLEEENVVDAATHSGNCFCFLIVRGFLFCEKGQ